MSGSTSFSNSTGSSTSTGVATQTSTGDESSSFSITAETTIQTSTPDGSDGLAAELGGSAVAIGDDTVAAGTIEGQIVDAGSVTTVDGSVTMVAASEDDENADAWADTFAYVSDGTEVMFTSSVEKQSTSQDTSGSTATATSTTTLTASDVDLSETEYSAPLGDGTGGDEALLTNDQPTPSTQPTDFDSSSDLDGNFASLEFNALAEGDNTFVSVDAFALAIEDELSVSEGFVVLGVD